MRASLFSPPCLKEQGVCLFVSVLHPKALSRLIHHPQDERGYPLVLVPIITPIENYCMKLLPAIR